MKYSTPRQRMKIYERMVRAIDRGEVFYICVIVDDFVGEKIGLNEIADKFPELEKVRPMGAVFNCLAWYNIDNRGMQARKRKLLKAIELCKKQF